MLTSRNICACGLLLGTMMIGWQSTAVSQTPTETADRGKRAIEAPTENLLRISIVPDPNDVPARQAIAQLGGVKGRLVGQPQPANLLKDVEPVDLDIRKDSIESPTKKLLAAPTPTTPKAPVAAPANAENSARRLDRGKADIEEPVEDLLAVTPEKKEEADPHPQLEETVTKTRQKNPKVEPGKVTWHQDFAAAKKASQASGKPVLLFQLMGKLDQRFT